MLTAERLQIISMCDVTIIGAVPVCDEVALEKRCRVKFVFNVLEQSCERGTVSHGSEVCCLNYTVTLRKGCARLRW